MSSRDPTMAIVFKHLYVFFVFESNKLFDIAPLVLGSLCTHCEQYSVS